MKKKWFVLLLVIVTSSIFCSCSNSYVQEEKEDILFSMDTVITMRATGVNIEEVFKKVRTRVLELEEKWSVTLLGSELYKINHANGNSVLVSNDTLELINYSLELAKKTSGCFDPSIYPIVSLWGFTTGNFQVPSDEEIIDALNNVGYEKISVNSDSVKLLDAMSLDFGGLGKGAALDESIKVMQENNVSRALINFGGNIGLIGNASNNVPWEIGVRNPSGNDNLAILLLNDCVVSTSGIYERNFIYEGHQYGHIMNPFTGRPHESEVLQVTVVAKEGKLADGLSTALYVMDISKAIELWRKENNFEFLLVTSDSEILITENLKSSFQLENLEYTVTTLTK